MQHAINWFEIPVSNIQKARTFYETVFQVGFREMEVGGNLMAIFDFEGVRGALWQESGYECPGAGTRIYLNMPDGMDAVLSRVESAGGSILSAKSLITTEIGWSAAIADPDGNQIGLYQEAPPAEQ